MRTSWTCYVHLYDSWMRVDRYHIHSNPTMDSATVVLAAQMRCSNQFYEWGRNIIVPMWRTYGLCGELNQTFIIISKLFLFFMCPYCWLIVHGNGMHYMNCAWMCEHQLIFYRQKYINLELRASTFVWPQPSNKWELLSFTISSTY